VDPATGSFDFAGIVPGSYTVVANDLGPVATAAYAGANVEVVDADVENVTLNLVPGIVIPGRLVIEGHTIVPNDPLLNSLVLTMRAPFWPIGYPAQVNPSTGTFTFTVPVMSGFRFSVEHGLPKNSFLRMARLGPVDLLSSTVPVGSDVNAQFDVVISMNGGAVDARVSDDRGASVNGATVVVIPDAPYRERYDLYRTGTTDASGQVHIDGTAPGNYRLFAWDDVDKDAWQDPDFITGFEDRGVILHVSEGAIMSVEVKVIP